MILKKNTLLLLGIFIIITSGVLCTEKAAPTNLILTLEELAQYDGQNSNPAYVAVDNIIYDISNSSLRTTKTFKSGKNVTKYVKEKNSKNYDALKSCPIVGKIIKVYTIEEIKRFNGKDGQAAYIVANGYVYNVSNVPEWKDGTYRGYSAGQDVSALEKASPFLKNYNRIGKIIKPSAN
ncbi:MAG: hypothetical protein DKM50_12235 [Candidatus Margulisiibacteriota bacterium]|nr:MAG: hypothetical protein DKM50_12235 [Candidatus Margulisiibacteriota bacterium]HAR63456.1 hypothetical protein [Candidatus Margulisiibacteriota bacterium]HCT85614.1 hypothetical protein [Candidatus Margulisiibacteriota bacterium]HCY37344.1 hypothetical protein [Candidatus Margulisiibacteriota bacterium]